MKKKKKLVFYVDFTISKIISAATEIVSLMREVPHCLGRHNYWIGAEAEADKA